jgi:hypothetical protein
MSRIAFNGNALGTGTVTIASPNTNSDRTLTLPDETGTVLLNGGAASFSTLTVSSNNISAVNSLGFRNRIINGDMRIDQRNAGASGTSNDTYVVDRWAYFGSQASKATWQQNAGSITPPAGFSNYFGFTSSSAYSVGASELFVFSQKIEGFNTSDLNFGTANAQTVTLSFWVRSSLTGTFGGYVANSAQNRNYPFSYTISSSNTWEQKSVTIAGDTTGTWIGGTNGIGMRVGFSLGIGSTNSTTANAWNGTANAIGVTGATSVVGTNGATFYITGVQLEAGSVATPFERRDYGRELIMCQRYCFVPASNSRYVGQCDSTTRALIIYVFPQTMRSGPAATLASAATYTVTTAAGGTVAGTAVSLSGGFLDSAQIGITVASGLVAGNATLVTANGTTIFSAEL